MEAVRLTSRDTQPVMFFKTLTLQDLVTTVVQNAFSTERIRHFVGSTAVSVGATVKHRHIFKETATAVQKID